MEWYTIKVFDFGLLHEVAQWASLETANERRKNSTPRISICSNNQINHILTEIVLRAPLLTAHEPPASRYPHRPYPTTLHINPSCPYRTSIGSLARMSLKDLLIDSKTSFRIEVTSGAFSCASWDAELSTYRTTITDIAQLRKDYSFLWIKLRIHIEGTKRQQFC